MWLKTKDGRTLPIPIGHKSNLMLNEAMRQVREEGAQILILDSEYTDQQVQQFLEASPYIQGAINAQIDGSSTGSTA